MFAYGFKLAAGFGELWTRDGVAPQLYADNLKCTSGDPDLFLGAARFTTGYVRLVGQEPAPSKCVLLSTSREVRKDMRDWVLSQECDKWSVKYDVRDLGGHLDTTFRGWSDTLAARVRLVISRQVFNFLCICLLLMVLKLLCWHWIVCLSSARLSVGWFGLVVSPQQVSVPCLAVWMGLLGVTLLFVQSGLGFVSFVGIWLCGPLRLVVLIVFLKWSARVALGMVLFIFSLLVLLRLASGGIL